ncbi:MAG TPA: 50S ribosomal protein L16 [Planctomycetes bacterium]|nr:50S ribosomal protein L16 [Planctomycetota bacterium]HIN79860.1 50S ribosomal protein L16 [Planctomycetota bacterium]
MALMPKRVKHRKVQRGKVRGNATRGNFVAIGEFGLMALQGGYISARQIEAGRIAGNHYLAGEGKVRIRIFPDKPVTATAAETRMGKGKGEPEFWAAVVRPGTILYEIQGAPLETARVALNRIAHKMPIRVRMVSRRPSV